MKPREVSLADVADIVRGVTHPLRVEDLAEFVTLYHPANRNARAPTWSTENPEGRWRSDDYEALAARDKASLDIFWLKDDALADYEERG